MSNTQKTPMGSHDRVSANDTAKILGVSVRHVHHLVRRGLLRPYYPRGRGLNAAMRFSKAEISALVEARESNKFDARRIAFTSAQALAASKQLERRVSLLEQALGQRIPGLPLDEESVIALYVRAVDEAQAPKATVATVMFWAETLLAAGEEFLDVLEAYTGDEECWKPFMDVAHALLVDSADATNIELKAAHGYLTVGLRNIRNAAFQYNRTRFGNRTATSMFDAADTCHEQILAILATNW